MLDGVALPSEAHSHSLGIFLDVQVVVVAARSARFQPSLLHLASSPVLFLGEKALATVTHALVTSRLDSHGAAPDNSAVLKCKCKREYINTVCWSYCNLEFPTHLSLNSDKYISTQNGGYIQHRFMVLIIFLCCFKAHTC